jgi:mono/diheme cytochrome c family protein
MSQSKKTKTLLGMGLGVSLILLSACQPDTSNEYTLPAGDAAAGEAMFVQIGCHACHTVSGVDGLRDEETQYERTIPLGGEKPRVYTYGELLTSIVNPSHQISQRHLRDQVAIDGQSVMRDYNDILTISELTDLVAFLEAHYTLKHYEPTHYYPYGPM